MAGDTLVVVDLVVVAAKLGLVAEKVDSVEALVLDVSEAVSLVPSSGENVKRDLTTNGVSEREVREASFECGDHIGTDVVFFIVFLEIVALLDAGITANRRDVYQTLAKLNKSTANHGEVELTKVSKDKLDEFVVFGLSDPLNEALGLDSLAKLVGLEAVLAETVVKHVFDIVAKLFFLFGQVRAAHEANSAFLAKLCEHILNFRSNGLTRRSQSSVDIKKDESFRVLTVRKVSH